MTEASEALEQVHYALDRSALHATHLGRLLALPIDVMGRPSSFSIPHVRQMLCEAMRDAADGCEVIGVQHNDTRWAGAVALIHNASTHVYSVHRAQTCVEIADLMIHMRKLVTVLKDRAIGHEVKVRLSG